VKGEIKEISGEVPTPMKISSKTYRKIVGELEGLKGENEGERVRPGDRSRHQGRVG